MKVIGQSSRSREEKCSFWNESEIRKTISALEKKQTISGN